MIMNRIVQNFSHDWQQKWCQKSLCCFEPCWITRMVWYTQYILQRQEEPKYCQVWTDIFYLVLMRNIFQEIHKLKPTTFTEWKKAGRSLEWRKQCSVRLQVFSPILAVGIDRNWIVGKPWQELLGFLMQKDTSTSQGRRTQWKIFQKSIWAQASLTENENGVI